MKATNEALQFVLELCMLAALAVWGATVNVAVAIAAPLAAVAVWGVWLAPRSERRLPASTRIPLQVVLFALAAAALAGSRHTAAATAFGIVAAVSTALAVLWGEGHFEI
jgi:uncharacterized protein DUF2568